MITIDSMKKTVLIVEDDKLLCDVYKKVLVGNGYRVVATHNFDSAVAKFNPQKIDIVVLDIILSGKNGFEVLKSFRAKSGGDKVPIVVITGMNTQDIDMDRELMVSLNILGIHTKSQFSISQFSDLISKYISLHERA